MNKVYKMWLAIVISFLKQKRKGKGERGKRGNPEKIKIKKTITCQDIFLIEYKNNNAFHSLGS